MTALQIYDSDVRPLPVSEKLLLARIILDNIPAETMVDSSSEWSDEDLHDISEYSMRLAEKRLNIQSCLSRAIALPS